MSNYVVNFYLTILGFPLKLAIHYVNIILKKMTKLKRVKLKMGSKYKIKLSKEELKILSSLFPNMRVLELINLVISQNSK